MPIGTRASKAGANPAPSAGVEALQGPLTSLTLRAAALAKAAALHLGLDAASAEVVGQTATLVSGDKIVTLLPLGQTDDGALSLMLGVSTTQRIAAAPDGLQPAQVLLNAPGALSAFSVALGATPDGCWMLYRSLVAGANEGQKVAQAVISTVRLADFVLDPATAIGH